MNNEERIFIYTNPIFWVYKVVVFIINAPKWVWKKLLWNNKRFYWHAYDYYVLKKKVSKGVTKLQLDNLKAWVLRNEKSKNKYRYIEKIKLLIEKEEINFN